MNPIQWKIASEMDVPNVVELVNKAYRGAASEKGWTTESHLLSGQRTDAEAVREMVSDEDSCILLAQSDSGGVSGCVYLRTLPSGAAYLGMLTVDPERQAGGIGRQLLARSEQIVRERWKAAAIEMTVLIQRDELIAWYVRRGYRRTGRFEEFPYGDERFGIPLTRELRFEILRKNLR